MENCCATLQELPPQSCDCNYVLPTITKLLVRQNKKGQYQIKINGKGKWIAAEYDEETKIVRVFT